MCLCMRVEFFFLSSFSLWISWFNYQIWIYKEQCNIFEGLFHKSPFCSLQINPFVLQILLMPANCKTLKKCNFDSSQTAILTAAFVKVQSFLRWKWRISGMTVSSQFLFLFFFPCTFAACNTYNNRYNVLLSSRICVSVRQIFCWGWFFLYIVLPPSIEQQQQQRKQQQNGWRWLRLRRQQRWMFCCHGYFCLTFSRKWFVIIQACSLL